MMRRETLRADGLLLMAALIWGSGFVAQRTAMDHVGPISFTALRYLIGALLVGLVLRFMRPGVISTVRRSTVLSGCLLGMVMFLGAGLQQAGLVYTSASRAGFITGIYVLLVPAFGRPLGHRSSRGDLLGAALAVIGMGLLSLQQQEQPEITKGDFLVLACAAFWALHVVLVGTLARHHDPVLLAWFQFTVVAILGGAVAGCCETITPASVWEARWPLLYSGAFSIGIAFTFQVIAQRQAPPTHAAVLMSFEAVFAAVFGWLLLAERLNLLEWTGCLLMFAGVVTAQLWPRRNNSLTQSVL